MKNLIFALTLILINQQAFAAKLATMFPNSTLWTDCVKQFDDYHEALVAAGTPNITVLQGPFYYEPGHIAFGILNFDGYNANGFMVGGVGQGGCHVYTTLPKSELDRKVKEINTKNDTIACGSVIDYKKKVVTEFIPIDATGLNLVYASNYNSLTPQSRTVTLDVDLSGYTTSVIFKTTANNSNPITTQPIYLGNDLRRFTYTPSNNGGITYSDSFKSKMDVNFSAQKEYSDVGGGCYYDERTDSTECPAPEKIYLDIFSQTAHKIIYKPEVWGLNAWTIDVHHYFDKETHTLFTGDGRELAQSTVKNITDSILGDVDVILDRDNGQQIFIFDSEGRHLETRHATMGYTIYKFIYNANNSISKIIDRTGKEINFIFDSNNKLTKITSQYGIETLVETVNGLTQSVTNSLNSKYEMTYGSYNLLNTYKSISGVETAFTYNNNGEFLTENKNVGLAQEFSEIISNGYTEFKHYVTQISSETVSIYPTTIYPGTFKYLTKVDGKDRLLYSKQFYYNAYKEQTNSDSYSELSENQPDPFWGADFFHDKLTYYNFYNYDEANTRTEDYIRTFETRSFESSNPLKPTTTQISSQNYVTLNLVNININNSTKTINSQDSRNRQSSLTYNEKGLPTEIKLPGQLAQIITYNNNSQVIRSEKGSTYEDYAYDQHGYLASITNSKNQTTSFIRDAQGKVLTQTLPNSDQIKYEYTAAAEIKKITAPNNQVHNFQLSLGDYLQNYLTPNNKQTSFDYDQHKRLTQITKASGKTINYNYEQDTGFIESLHTSDGNYTFSDIDQYGRPKNITSADNVRINIHWVQNQMQRQTWYDTDGSELATISNTYMPNQFKIKDLKINNQVIATYDYDRELVQSINNAQYTYNTTPTSNNISISYSNLAINYSSIDEQNQNPAARSITATAKQGADKEISISLKRSFDNFGQAQDYSTLTVNSPNGILNSHYELVPEYDANNRLVQIQKNRKSYINGQEVSATVFYNHYNYPLGSNNNMKEFSQTLTQTSAPQKRTIASHDNEDRLTSLRGSIHRDYTYTDDGDIKTMTNCYGTTTYDYDVFGNLKKVTLADGKVIEYKVDAMNRRVKKLVNGVTKEYYLWYDQIHLAAILDANKEPVLTYIYGPESQTPSYIIKDNVTYRILHDPGLGSIRYIVNPATQQIVQDIEYDEYGNVMKNTNADFQPLTYAGGLYDSDTKLIRFGARDYDPTIGRWTAKDPIGFAGGDTNLYAYVGGNPMSYNDPTGNCPWCVVGIGALVGASANVFGSALAGTLNYNNLGETILIGGISGAAAVVTAGAVAASVGVTTLTGLLAIEIGAGQTLIGAGVATGVDLGLNIAFNSPPPGVTAQQLQAIQKKKQNPCPLK
ncbi:MAG: RHS repeat-associated core domain-containing protein [Pseudobdellovibrio sp.]